MGYPHFIDVEKQAPRLGPFVELRHCLLSEIKSVSPFVDELMGFIRRSRIPDESEIDIEIAVREALLNAVIHGSRDNSGKHIYVECRCYIGGEVSITVRDEGHGFEIDAVPDPTAPKNVLSSHGRGIYLMNKMMDEIRFEEHGTVVRMHKKVNGERPRAKKVQ